MPLRSLLGVVALNVAMQQKNGFLQACKVSTLATWGLWRDHSIAASRPCAAAVLELSLGNWAGQDHC